MPRVSINIVTWNGMEYLPDLLASIFKQTFTDFSVRVIDNASTDGVVDYVRGAYPQVTVIRNANNLGFGAAHNQGIRFAIDKLGPLQNGVFSSHGHPSTPLNAPLVRFAGLDSPFNENPSVFQRSHKCPPEELSRQYVLVTNQDIVMTPTFLERLVAEADAHPEAGSFGGKLMKAFGENLLDETLKETVSSDLLDSTGLRADRRRCFVERGAGEIDRGQYDADRDVFGLSGALVLYRASALQDIAINGEYFDEDFFMYKEDIDLAWRLQARGWSARFVPDAVASHYRGMYGKEKAGVFELMRNRRKKSLRRSFFSTRNHWCLLFKNVPLGDWLLFWPWILGMEAMRFGYVCLCETKNAPAFLEAISWMPRMWRKRRWVMRNRKVRGRELRRWFV